MDPMSISRPRLWTYLWVCGVAVALGWGIRGQFGHERGAMVPGVMGALAIVLISPDENKRNRVAAIGVAGGLGLAIGGSMSYGSIAGSLGKPGFGALCTVLLAFKGAIWGGIAGGILGMALSPVRYRFQELLWLLPVGLVYFLMSQVHPEGEISRGDNVWGLLAALVVMVLWLGLVKQDRAAIFVGACSAVGFGFGFPFGSWLCVFGEHTGVPVDWWKVAEMTWGLCGGLSWGLAAYALDEELVEPPNVRWGLPAWLGIVYIAWLVPFWNGFNSITYWVIEKRVLPHAVIPLYLCAVGAVLIAAILAVRSGHGPRSPMAITAVALLWVAWSTFAMQFAKMGFPGGFTGGGFWWTQVAFICCGVLLTVYALTRLAHASRT